MVSLAEPRRARYSTAHCFGGLSNHIGHDPFDGDVEAPTCSLPEQTGRQVCNRQGRLSDGRGRCAVSDWGDACMDACLQGCRACGELGRAVVERRLEQAAEGVELRREQAAEVVPVPLLWRDARQGGVV